jgi:hypothetical protein
MKISGRRITRDRWVHTPNYVVSVRVEAVIPDADPSEACYEPETVQFLREVEQHAQDGDINWLRRHGRVYRVMDPV